MNELRKQFEALPEISDKINTVQFSEQFNTYHAIMVNSSTLVKFIQGAWYAFQEQQKKIDAAMQYLDNCERKIELDKNHILELLK